MALLDDSFALIAPNLRSIGGIIPDVTIEEHHHDRYIITEHPVETGAAITDHAFRVPAEAVMKIGFSNSTARAEGAVQQAYETIKALGDARQPFDVYTGKRAYQNMLVDVISVTTDPTSEYVLDCTVALREIIITSTAQGSPGDGSTPDASAPQDQQAMPEQTSSVQPGGFQSIGAGGDTPTFAQSQSQLSGLDNQDFSSVTAPVDKGGTVAGGFTSGHGTASVTIGPIE